MKKNKIPFNLYRGEISRIFFINKQNVWQVRMGKFKGETIPSLIKQYGLDNVLEFLYSIYDHEDCVGIEKMQVKEIVSELKRIESLKFI